MQLASPSHTRGRIGVWASSLTGAQERMFATLGQRFAARFVRCDSRSLENLDALVTLGCSEEEVGMARSSGLPLLCFDEPTEPRTASADPICFSNSADSPGVLRGRCFGGTEPRAFRVIRPQPGESVLATLGGLPVWTARASNGRRWFRSGMPFPTLEAKEGLLDFRSAQRFPYIVPLLEIVREATDDQSWRFPLRATLMFDDPNLHWPKYGCIDYRLLAASGATHRYHTSIATVPLDTWYSHPVAASVFRQHPDQLSLLVHGNNHTHAELLRDRSRPECRSYLRQAEGRVRSLEARSGVPVSRVMAAPHGACSEMMLTAMVDVGFEAAVISPGSLRCFNPDSAWVSGLGLAVTEYIGGLPVIPRLDILRDCQTRILVATYLRQPIIPTGHHWDVADGLELLESTAAFINSLGVVQWCDLATLARSHYATRLHGDEMQVRLFSRHVVLPVPHGVQRLHVEKSWSSGGHPEEIEVRCDGASVASEDDGEATHAAIRAQGTLVIRVNRIESSPNDGPLPSTGVWPIARRALAECRDRLYPLRRSVRLRR